jgi:hypothetical protein
MQKFTSSIYGAAIGSLRNRDMPPMAIEEANTVVFREIEGWVGDRIHLICSFIKEFHEANAVTGSIAEIGVHHGKLFFLLAHVAAGEETLVAIDLFDDQKKNMDGSGKGSMKKFMGHMYQHFPYLAGRTKVLAKDSLGISLSDIESVFDGRVRVLSVDGGHTVTHVVNDLSIAQEALTDRGIVMLDDFMGPHWPSVSEGFFRYMDRYNRRLAPFLIFQNKLFLTNYSDQPQVLAELRRFLDARIGDEIHSSRWRYAELCGSKVLCYS